MSKPSSKKAAAKTPAPARPRKSEKAKAPESTAQAAESQSADPMDAISAAATTAPAYEYAPVITKSTGLVFEDIPVVQTNGRGIPSAELKSQLSAMSVGKSASVPKGRLQTIQRLAKELGFTIRSARDQATEGNYRFERTA